VVIRNRRFDQGDLVTIRRLIRRNPHIGRTKLSELVCEELCWVQPSGRLKDRACRVALLRLEQLGHLTLPPRLTETGGKPPSAHVPENNAEPTALIDSMPSGIKLVLVRSRAESRLWNWFVAKHHYLGLPTPVGRTARYLVFGNAHVFGAIGFTECAWKVSSRAEALVAIGLSAENCHNYVINNNRFVIHPLVRIRNLASGILSKAASQVERDWHMKYGHRPLIIETFVDPAKYSGTCYFAANWLLVGFTKGFAKKGASHQRKNEPKLLLLRGVRSSIQRKLAAVFPPGKKPQWTEAA
jgi:Domain of unknown function (DUF4338)